MKSSALRSSSFLGQTATKSNWVLDIFIQNATLVSQVLSIRVFQKDHNIFIKIFVFISISNFRKFKCKRIYAIDCTTDKITFFDM